MEKKDDLYPDDQKQRIMEGCFINLQKKQKD